MSRLNAIHHWHIDVHKDKLVVGLAACLFNVAFIHFDSQLSILSSINLNSIGRSQDHLQRHHIVEVVLCHEHRSNTLALFVLVWDFKSRWRRKSALGSHSAHFWLLILKHGLFIAVQITICSRVTAAISPAPFLDLLSFLIQGVWFLP